MKLEVSMAAPMRRQFADAFKSEAVRLTRESGRPVPQVARDWGLEIVCSTAGGASSDRPNPGAAHARQCGPSRTSWPASTRKRDAAEGVGFFNTCGGVFREGIPLRYPRDPGA